MDGPQTQNVMAGNAFMLTCNATGFSVPAIMWRQNGTSYNIRDPSVITVTITHGLQSRSSILNVTNAIVSDTGLYQCVATNVVNTVMQNATIIVQGKYDPWLHCFKMVYPQTFHPSGFVATGTDILSMSIQG